MPSSTIVARPSQEAPEGRRTAWVQLCLGLICMIAISSPQYVWALFTQPLSTALSVGLPELQITFSIRRALEL